MRRRRIPIAPSAKFELDGNLITEKKEKDANELTLLQTIERVVELSKDSELDDEFLESAEPELSLLSSRLGVTPVQAVLFSICLDCGPYRINYDDLAGHLDMSNVRVLSYGKDLDALVRRRLLRYRDVVDGDSVGVPRDVLKALKNDEVPELPNIKGLNVFDFFEAVNRIFNDLIDDAATVDDARQELEELVAANPKLEFVKRLRALKLGGADWMILFFFIHLCVNKDDNRIRSGELSQLFTRQSRFSEARSALQSGEHPLMVKKLIEHGCEGGIADPTTYCLTSSAKSNLLCELNLKTSDSDVRISDLRNPADITPKEMFYPAEVGKQVVELSSFLSQEKYGDIHERMQQQGFRQSFACLFYGGPGTGKTETVYQLARRTGRPIMTVDVPQIKSKWVGESEKNLKALFERYRDAVNRCEVAPILFFNEADAIIGKRKSGAEYAVDKMENTLQNILLQEMENLDGILIATTNLEGNLDSAFERRFLYKIKFETPDATVRAKIWQEMIKDLTEAEAEHLAKIFDFSGGQIENVARKYAISGILYGAGAKPRLEQLVDYCKSEQLASKTVAKSVGFHTV